MNALGALSVQRIALHLSISHFANRILRNSTALFSMALSPINPFTYGGVVGAEAFCNRTDEIHDLVAAARSADRLLVYAERRMGKTSLVGRVGERLRTLDAHQQVRLVYVDLWPATTVADVARLTAKAVAQATASRAEAMLEASRTLFRRLVPSLTVDEEGKPVVTFGARSVGAPDEPLLEEAFEAPEKLAVQTGERVLVVYDEVQRLGELGSDVAERVLRSAVQHHTRTAYFFMGSRRHLVQRLFMEPSRPLYGAAGHYPLGTIGVEAWTPFVEERFARAGKRILPPTVALLVAKTQGHPYYTQHLAHALWERTPVGDEATPEKLDEALGLVLERLSYPFSVLWESLTANGRSLLKGLAEAGPGAQPFSSQFLQARGLAASSAHRVAERLLERDVIDREAEGYVILDRFFRLWIERL